MNPFKTRISMHQPARFILLWIVLPIFWGGAVAFADEALLQPEQMVPESQMPFLGELLEHASRQAPQVLLKNIELAQMESSRLSAASARLPSVYASARESYDAVSLSSGEGGYNKGTGFFYNVGARQPLFHWGALAASAKIGELGVKMKQREYADAYITLLTSVRSQFLGLVLHKMTVARREASLALAQDQYKLTSQKVADGALGRAYLRAADYELKESELALNRARSDFRNARRLLAILVGVSDVPEERVPNSIECPVSIERGQAANFMVSGRAVDQLPMAQYYRMRIEQGKLDYKLAKYRLYPKVDISLGTSLDNQISTYSSTVEQASTYRHYVALSVNWNIFDGFATKGAKQRAIADRQWAERLYANYLSNTSSSRQYLLEQLDIVLQSSLLAESRLEDALGSVRYADAEVAAGRMAEAQRVQSYASLRDAEINAASARYAIYVKLSELLGAAWADPMLKKIPSSFLSYDR
jgi:outer membrane protein TolC